jgi:hypothetical protein
LKIVKSLLCSFHSSRVASNLLMVLSSKFISPRII